MQQEPREEVNLEGAALIPATILDTESASVEREFEFINEERLGGRAIVVRRLFSPEECQRMIDFMEDRNHLPVDESDIVMVPAHSEARYRNNLRVIATSETIASELYRRVTTILDGLSENVKVCSPQNKHEFLTEGIGMNGSWRATSLNFAFRLCKYNTLGHFGPHSDSDFVVNPTQHRSLKTFMIYLNDDYDGGETNFCEEHDIHFDAGGLACSPSEKVFKRFKARQGDCLVFDHNILHEGAKVLSGVKYIMRSELMYTKEEQASTTAAVGGSAAATGDALEAEALSLFYEGTRLEAAGLHDEACRKYNRAIKLCPALERGL